MRTISAFLFPSPAFAQNRRWYAPAVALCLFVVTAGAARAQNVEAGKRAFFKGNYDQAITSLTSPRPSVLSLLWLSRTYQAKGELKMAAKVLTSVSNWAEFAPLLNRMGEVELALGNYDKARTFFTRALAKSRNLLDATLNLAELDALFGRKENVRRSAQQVIELFRETPYPDARLTYLTARACVLVNRIDDANDLFFDAVKLKPEDWRFYIAWGNLFLDKYNAEEAISIFEDALRQNKNAVAAHLGLARAYARKDMGRALAIIEKLLDDYEKNPEVLIAAARLFSMTESLDSARETIERAIKIVPGNLHALTVAAEIALLQKDDGRFRRIEGKIMKINPAFSTVYTRAGETLARRYLFREAIGYFEKAVRLNPDDAAALSGLGTARSRLAMLEPARQALEKAFALDPYNLYTGNLLKLFDSYVDYDTIQTEHFLIRLHESDRDVIGPYAAELAEKAWQAIVPRYGLQMQQKVTLEIFPKHDDFAVRCFGLPGAEYFLGICFGPLITMNSPRARPFGTFNWMETLWHEFAHVVHLTLTNNRVPRWLAEGISVYEATRANPAWAMNHQVMMIEALQKDELIPLLELDRNFTGDPRRVTFSYYQSSLITEYVVEQYGMQALIALLQQFRQDRDTQEALKRVLNLDAEKFDNRFSRYLRSRFLPESVVLNFDSKDIPEQPEEQSAYFRRRIAAEPADFYATLRLGIMLIDEDQLDEGIRLLERAAQLYPDYREQDNPWRALARAYARKGDDRRSALMLREVLKRDAKSDAAALKLEELARKLGEPEWQEQALLVSMQINPYRAELHRRLGDLYLQKNEPAAALREYRIELALNPTDKAGVHCRIADAALRLGRKEQARRHALKALEIAPMFTRAQDILLRTAR